jgi:hypothetical protein
MRKVGIAGTATVAPTSGNFKTPSGNIVCDYGVALIPV